MKLLMIFGPQAVGKMTVGQELEKITNLKLFHNHMTIDLLSPIFGFTDEMWRLSNMFRMEVFKSAAKSNLDGLIFTFVWAFDMKEDWDFVKEISDVFKNNRGDVYLVELEAKMEERLQRNQTANRLKHKPSKRNIQQSKKNLIQTMEQHRLQSMPGEIAEQKYMRINNTRLDAAEVARMIKIEFLL